MANFKQHVTAGAVVGAGLNLAWQIHKLSALDEPPVGFWETVIGFTRPTSRPVGLATPGDGFRSCILNR